MATLYRKLIRDDNMTTIYETRECEEEATILEE